MQQLSITFKYWLSIGLLSVALGGAFTYGTVSWSASMSVTPAAIAPQLDSPTAPLLLDVRSEEEFSDGHIPGAINIPYRELPGRLDELVGAETKAIVVYCEVGVRAGIAEVVLDQAGFEQVFLLEGHMQAWREAGFLIDTGAAEPSP